MQVNMFSTIDAYVCCLDIEVLSVCQIVALLVQGSVVFFNLTYITVESVSLFYRVLFFVARL